MRSLVAALLLALLPQACGILTPVLATWKPEYAKASPDIQAWYRNAELTEEAKLRFPFKKCCDHADVVRTKFHVNKTTGGDECSTNSSTSLAPCGASPTTSSIGEKARRAGNRRCSSSRARRRASSRAIAGSEG
jgi:hypothetical protein